MDSFPGQNGHFGYDTGFSETVFISSEGREFLAGDMITHRWEPISGIYFTILLKEYSNTSLLHKNENGNINEEFLH